MGYYSYYYNECRPEEAPELEVLTELLEEVENEIVEFINNEVAFLKSKCFKVVMWNDLFHKDSIKNIDHDIIVQTGSNSDVTQKISMSTAFNQLCLDMEGVLVPEIWIAFAEASGIPQLKRTTRDEPDYDKLMQFRLNILKEHGLGLKEIQATIAKIDPLPGAKAFLDELRATTQVIILSDTFEQFAKPLMEKLGWPTIFCNTLEVAENGDITGYQMRCEKSKLTTVRALQSCGFETIAAGDSFNDLGMIQASKAGFLFKSTAAIKADYPELPAYEEFDDLLAAIKAAL